MSIDNYGELKTAVANWLKRDDLTSRIPEFIAGAEDRIAIDLRIRAMETTADLTVSSQTVALPTGFLAQRRLYLDTSTDRKRLDFYPPADFWMRRASSETGTPVIYTVEGDNIVFGPTPDATYTGKILYYQRFTALSGDSDTNWLLSNQQFLLLYGALIEASPFVGDDPRTMTWAMMYDDRIEKMQQADRDDRYPDSLQSHSQVSGP